MKYILLSLMFWLSGIFVIVDTFTNGYSLKDTSQKSKTSVVNENTLVNEGHGNTLPKVQLLLSPKEEFYTWDASIRYSIDVSDLEDGESKFGEINPNEVILEVEYLPTIDAGAINRRIEASEKEVEQAGLTLMKKSTCFNCHADKAVHTGPSFLEIANKYEKNEGHIKLLAGSIMGGSVEVWGDRAMPAHPQLRSEEAEQIADYILTQGARKYSQVLSGLEGVFRTIEKPLEFANGSCILTASYVSKSMLRGQQSVVLELR